MIRNFGYLVFLPDSKTPAYSINDVTVLQLNLIAFMPQRMIDDVTLMGTM
jgi:hypothetical protein